MLPLYGRVGCYWLHAGDAKPSVDSVPKQAELTECEREQFRSDVREVQAENVLPALPA
jgi:hypothetical protein